MCQYVSSVFVVFDNRLRNNKYILRRFDLKNQLFYVSIHHGIDLNLIIILVNQKEILKIIDMGERWEMF